LFSSVRRQRNRKSHIRDHTYAPREAGAARIVEEATWCFNEIDAVDKFPDEGGVSLDEGASLFGGWKRFWRDEE